MLHKRLIVLALSLLVLIAPAIVATRFIGGHSNQQPTGKKLVKVLRRSNEIRWKPTAKEIQEEQAEPKERIFDNTVPKHLPFKIKLKKEKEEAFKDLKNDKWLRDFAIEFTNTGTKPIYSVYMLLVLPEIRNSSGANIVFPLWYGRDELGTTKTKALPEDIPIKPGETHVFTIFELQIPTWEYLQRKEKRPQPKIVQLKLQVVSFGDGTGLVGNDGAPVPRFTSQALGLDCPEPANQSPPGIEALKATLGRQQSSSTEIPASFLPVNFYNHSVSLKPKPAPQGCCTGDGCTTLTPYRARVCLNCPPQERPGISTCGDPESKCVRANQGSIECFISNGGEPFLCQTWDLIPCDGGTSPTPTPTPTPTPSPSPTATPIPCPFTAASNCASGVPRDYCLNPDQPEINIYTGGCPPLLRAEGNCCLPVPCPSPTPTPPVCGGTLIFNPAPTCRWSCLSLGGGGGGSNIVGYNGYECTTYYWVLYSCMPTHETGETDWNCSEVDRWYAGCW